jgi:transcriptional antiterminator NusG
VKKPVVSELNIDDTVEVIAGPFKSMKAKITRVDYEKQEATVLLLDSPYQIPVTVDANYLKKVAH